VFSAIQNVENVKAQRLIVLNAIAIMCGTKLRNNVWTIALWDSIIIKWNA